MGFIINILLSFFLFFMGGCTSLIYWPDHYLHSDLKAMGVDYLEYLVPSIDGTKLLAWEVKSKTPHPENLILMFHGNAENLSSHVHHLLWMIDYRSDLLIFDYRGYGVSQGTPDPQGVYQDGLTFLNLAYQKFKAKKYKRLIIYAQSLGGAVFLRALEDISWGEEISLIVLDSTFLSVKEVVNAKTHYLLGWTISSAYIAKPDLIGLTMPLLVIHSEQDPIIPFSFGQELFLKAPSLKKTFWKIAEKGHGDVFFIKNQEYRKKFLSFLDFF